MQLALEVFLIAFMWAMTIVSIYRRRVILRGRMVYASKRDRHWQAGTTIFSVLFGIPAAFFAVVVMTAVWKGTKLGPDSLFFACTAVIFFGNLANNFAPWRARTILTDRGVLYPFHATGGWHWSRIKGFQWSKAPDEKSFQLTLEIRHFGFLNAPIPLRGHFDGEAKRSVDALLKEKVKGKEDNKSSGGGPDMP